jgi:PBP1b-binding outer membrane lipoprotein LpoB
MNKTLSILIFLAGLTAILSGCASNPDDSAAAASPTPAVGAVVTAPAANQAPPQVQQPVESPLRSIK